MSSKNKSQLRVENNASFPNNNSQFITPELLRTFNENIIDSMVSNEDSGSYLLTASYDTGSENLTFTKQDTTTFDVNIPAGGDTGSLLETASFDNGTRNMTFTKGDSSTFDVNIPDATVNTGSLLTTASVSDATITFTKGDASTFDITVNNVVSASYAVSSSQADNATSASHAVNSLSASHAEQADNATSSSNSISSSVVSDPNIAYINKNNTFTGTQNFDNISVSGTGSFGRINSVTGSAKIIGDAFVVVNADTPTLRYAGLQVYDSGSSATASLEWDGQNDSWILVEEGGKSSFILTGPTGSKGSETNLTNNSLPKGAEHRQLIDSNISDDGSTITLGSTTNVSGPLSASNLDSIEITNLQNSGSEDRTRINDLANATGSYATTGSNTFTGTQDFQNNISQSVGNFNSLGQVESQGNHIINSQFPIFQAQGDFGRGEIYAGFQINDAGSTANSSFAVNSFPDLDGTQPILEIVGPGNTRHFWSSASSSYSHFPQLSKFQNGMEITGSLTITDDVYINGTLSSSLQEGYVWVGGSGNRTITAETSSFGGGGGFPFEGNAVITGSLGISGSLHGGVVALSISSNTASLDMRDGNMFTLTLASSADTNVDVNNLIPGQTINLRVTQPATSGSISFSNNVRFPNGNAFTATATGSVVDLVTFVTFDSTNVEAVGIKNLS